MQKWREDSLPNLRTLKAVTDNKHATHEIV